MNWSGQILHIVQRDLSRAKIPLLIYLVAIALAAVSAATVSTAGNSAMGAATPFLLGAIAAFIVAGAVQADSPVRSDALWMSQPLYPSALLTAKGVAIVLLLVLVLVVAQAAALAAVGVSVASTMGAVMAGTWVTFTALLVTAALASLTRDMRSLFIAMIVFLITLPLLQRMRESVMETNAPMEVVMDSEIVRAVTFGSYEHLSPIVWTAWPIAAFVVLAHQYLTRNRKRGVILATTLLMVLQLVVTPSGNMGRAEFDYLTDGVPAVPPNGELVVQPQLISGDVYKMMENVALIHPSQARLINATVQIHMDGAPANVRRLLLRPRASMVLADGSRSNVLVRADKVVLNDPDPMGTDSYREVSARQRTGSSAYVPLQLTDEQFAAIAAGDAKLEVRGEVLLRESQTATLPLVTGSHTTLGGAVITLVSHLDDDDGVRFSVSTLSGADPTVTRIDHRLGVPRFALVNDATSELVWLAGNNPAHSRGSQLLGPTIFWEENQLLRSYSIAQEPSPLSTLPREWTNAASLLVTVWRSTGRFPVNASVTVIPAASGQPLNVTAPDASQSGVGSRIRGGR